MLVCTCREPAQLGQHKLPYCCPRHAVRRYVFVSNSDNLGATLDLDLLAYFAGEDKAFLMEVGKVQRTSSVA